MKLLQSILIKGIIIFSIATANAQSGYGNGYGGNGYGRTNREIGPSYDNKPSQKDIEKKRGENIKKAIEKLTKELNLDELQVIAITKVITDSEKTQNIIIAKQDSQETKNAELKAAMETTNRQIMEFLDKDQKEKYGVLIEKIKNK
ncbi:MAG: hypothetical protein V4548_03100 [Bacteroidota bacterium]